VPEIVSNPFIPAPPLAAGVAVALESLGSTSGLSMAARPCRENASANTHAARNRQQRHPIDHELLIAQASIHIV
jgi:hypothetical protein